MGFTWKAITRSLPFAVMVAGMLIAIRVYSWTIEARELGTPVKDERILMIEGKAGKLTIALNCYAMLALLLFNFVAESYGFNPLEARHVGAFSVLITAASYIGLRWWFGREPRGVK
jgi:hypothetical protein